MECEEARRLIDPLVDGELGLERSLEVEQHLDSCRECDATYRRLRALRGVIRASLTYQAAPTGFGNRLSAAVRQAAPRPVPPDWISALRYGGAGMFAAAVLAFLVLFLPRHVNDRIDDRIAEEALSGHLRSLMANHLADVMSSDKHTVKPFFAGKLDFSPPVVDLAKSGFPLVAGRLDYMDDRPVAALVYRRNKHLINVFVWPTSGAAAAPVARSQRGYQIVNWRADGMSEWAVSDLNAGELGEFAVDLIKNR